MSIPNSPENIALRTVLPPPPEPAANYVPVRQVGNMLYIAGQTPHVRGDLRIRGRVTEAAGAGKGGVNAEDARELAREAALNVVSAMRAHLGDLDHVEGIVSVTGFVASEPDFTRHPWVIDGASELFIEFFGTAGKHARAALGVASLPDSAPVELSVVALVRS